MVVENNKAQKMYSLYVSDFHLEMILLPYIKNKIEDNEEITILTQNDLSQTIQTLIEKTNLNNEEKRRILNLGWGIEEKELKENSNIIIIGRKEYIENVNEKIKKSNVIHKDIIDCYNLEEIKNEINNIICKYDSNLNTKGYNKN